MNTGNQPSDTPKHSPLPWVAAIPDDDTEAADCRFLAVIAKDERYHESTRDIFCVDTVPSHWSDPEESATDVANIRFIVKACNAHYALVEALRNWLRLFPCDHGEIIVHGCVACGTRALLASLGESKCQI